MYQRIDDQIRLLISNFQYGFAQVRYKLSNTSCFTQYTDLSSGCYFVAYNDFLGKACPKDLTRGHPCFRFLLTKPKATKRIFSQKRRDHIIIKTKSTSGAKSTSALKLQF